MAKYLDYEGLQYYTGKIKGTYDPQINEIKNDIYNTWEIDGKYNLFSPTLKTTTLNNVTFTLNDDKTYTLSGQASETAIVIVGTIQLSVGTYYLSGCPNGGADNSYRLDVRDILAQSVFAVNRSEDTTLFTLSSSGTYSIVIRINNGYEFTNEKIFKPMISLVKATYRPYAMSNVELTYNVASNSEIDNIWDNT